MAIAANNSRKIESRLYTYKHVFKLKYLRFSCQSNSQPLLVVFQEILLVDVEPKAMTALLTFLYTDEVTLSPDTVIPTLYAGLVIQHE